MQNQEKQQSSMVVSLDSLPKHILDKLKDYRFIQEERREDSEVENCFRSKSCELPSTPKSRDYSDTPLSPSPSTPRSRFSDDLVFRYPPRLPDAYSEKSDSNSTVRSSPYKEQDSCHIFGDNSDWMMAERLKPRSPPVSPSSRSSSISSPPIDPQRNMVLQSPESCFVRPHLSSRLDHLHHTSPNIERTPKKRCFSPHHRFDHHESLERTPAKRQELLLPGARSITGSGHKSESNADQLSPGFHERPDRSPSVRVPDYPGDYVDERRTVRKQLVFDGSHSPHDLYNRREQYSPRSRQCFDYDQHEEYSQRFTDQDSSALLSQLLGQLSKRKRKTSDRCDSCDCDCEERFAKKKRSDLKRQMNRNYLRQLENDVSVLNQQLRKSEIETRPENCSCAVMERQFLQMAENAYKNIRRQDSSADGFAQFRKELTETNQILKESLTVLNNMKEFCEHKSMHILS